MFRLPTKNLISTFRLEEALRIQSELLSRLLKEGIHVNAIVLI